MRVPRGGLLLLLFTQPPAPGLHLAFPSKANFFPCRSVHSVQLGSCKSLPGHQLRTLSRQPSQSGKLGYLFSRGWEVSDVGSVERLKGKRSVQGLSTSTEAVQGAKVDTEAEERRKKKWIADREVEQAEIQKGKRVWVGDGKLVYSSQKDEPRTDDIGALGDRNASSDSTAGYQRDGQGSRGGGGRGRGAGRGRGIERGRGVFPITAARDDTSSSLGKREIFYPEGSKGSSSETNAGDFSASARSSRGTSSRGGSSRGGTSRGGYGRGESSYGGFSRGGSSRGGFSRVAEGSGPVESNGSESNYGGTSRGGYSRGGSSRGRGGLSRGGFSRGGSTRGGFSRGGASRGGFSRGGSSRGGFSRGSSGRGGFTRGEFRKDDEQDSDIDNGGSGGEFRRGRPTRGGLSRGSGRGAFSRGESGTNDQNDSRIENGSNEGSDEGFSRGTEGSSRGAFSREGSSRGGYRGGFSREGSSRGGYRGGFSREGSSRGGYRGGFSREGSSRGGYRGGLATLGGYGRGNYDQGAFSRGRGGLTRGRGGFTRGRGGSGRGGLGRDSFGRRDKDDAETDNRQSEGSYGGRGGISRGRGSFRARDPRPQARLGAESSLAAGEYGQQGDDSDDSDEELLSTKTFSEGDPRRSEAFFDFEDDSDASDREDSEIFSREDGDDLDTEDSDDLAREDSAAPSTKSAVALIQEDIETTSKGDSDEVKDNVSAESQPLQREPGEENWKFMVRKKRAEAQRQSQTLTSDVENGLPEYQSEAYKERKVAWLCKEIPFLGPRDIVSILNAQKRWITAVETKQVIQHLVQIEHSIRAYRVHRWMLDQSWYEFDFELHTQMANLLCQLETTRRARDLFDQIIDARKVPDSSTFVALTSKYIEERLAPSIEEAWTLFNQMQQLGGYEPPPPLQYALFDALMLKSQGTPAFAERADMLFQKMKETGVERSREMFESLMTYHARKGNSSRVAALGEEMILEGIEVGSNVFSKMVDASAEEGSPEKAEKAFNELLEAGYRADVSVYTSLMTAYGKAGRYAEALEKFQAMEAAGIRPNTRAFDTIIAIMANAGQQADTEMLLEKLESSGRLPSVLTYNAVIQMYCKTSLTEEAERVFKQMLAKERHPDKTTYVVLIEHYAEKGLLEDAEAMYEEMRDRVQVSHKAYSLMLVAYGKAGQKDKLKELFEHPATRRFSIPDDCKKYLISVVGRREVEERADSKQSLQKSQRKALMGLLLGGARVETHDRDRTYEVHFELDPQGLGSSDVIDHLYQTFSEWAAGPPEVVTLQADQESEQVSTKKGFATVSHGSFRFFSHQFRNQGKPTIPKLIHRWLNPECLAYWYMYGGQRCDETGGIILNVADYSPKEILLVRKAMQQISLDCDIKERGGKRVLQLEGQSAHWMWKLIEPHVVDKLKDVLRPSSVLETSNNVASTGEPLVSHAILHAEETSGKSSTQSAEERDGEAGGQFPQMTELVQAN